MYECSICLEELSMEIELNDRDSPILDRYGLDEAGIYATKCGHLFHSACIATWMNGTGGSPRCPICKQVILTKSLVKIHLNLTPIPNRIKREDYSRLEEELVKALSLLDVADINAHDHYLKGDLLIDLLNNQKMLSERLKGLIRLQLNWKHMLTLESNNTKLSKLSEELCTLVDLSIFVLENSDSSSFEGITISLSGINRRIQSILE